MKPRVAFESIAFVAVFSFVFLWWLSVAAPSVFLLYASIGLGGADAFFAYAVYPKPKASEPEDLNDEAARVRAQQGSAYPPVSMTGFPPSGASKAEMMDSVEMVKELHKVPAPDGYDYIEHRYNFPGVSGLMRKGKAPETQTAQIQEPDSPLGDMVETAPPPEE